MSMSSDLEAMDGAVALEHARLPRARARSNRRDVAVGVAVAGIIAANGVVIVWLWLKGGGISGVHGRAEGFTSLGRLTGLIAVYLALLQLVMLARVPALERLFGFDEMSSWHAFNGKLCIALVVAHVMLITAGYSLADKISFGAEISRLIDVYPGMVTATVGTALMLLVVFASLFIVRRRLSYEGWYHLHLTIYAGIALAYFHQIPTGNEFAAHPIQADYWISLYAATLALLLVYRVWRPAQAALRHGLRVRAVTTEAEGVTSIEVTGRDLHRLRIEPGQFMLWRFLTKGRWWQSHPFSLSAAPDGRSLRLTVKAVGDFTRRLRDLEPGTKVIAEGPFGVFTSAVRRRERVLLIAGGIGITPLRALFEELAGKVDVVLLHRVLSKREAVFERELEQLAKLPQARFRLLVGDHRRGEGAALLSPSRLAKLVPDVAQRDVYVCGPAEMIEATLRSLRALKVPDDQLHTERFALAA